ncbi:MAG: redoxin family protein, partial [Thermoleophilaceae bacterium]|nr:redoxin family protein [Thermoleophilaceae bacterium]
DPGADRDPAPAISGPDVADPGKTVALEDFRGKPVVVQVWASWCPICNEEAPDIAAFQKANPDVVFIGVNVEDTQSEALAYKKRHGLTHEYDISDPDRETEGELGFTGQPNSMVIDKDGRVVEVFPGAVSKEQLEDALGQI